VENENDDENLQAYLKERRIDDFDYRPSDPFSSLIA